MQPEYKAFMGKLCISIVVILPFFGGNGAKSPQELWEIHLADESDIQGFERPQNRTWLQQQGVVFFSPARLAIYQVNRRRKPAPLSRRSASGGSGNFVLLARILEANTGREIKRLQFVTTADFSNMLPTHDGKFIVRAGNIVGLFSADFDLLLSRELPVEKHAQMDYWQVGVTPSGRELALVHQQRFLDPRALKDGAQTAKGQSQADVEMMDADTFRTITKLHLPYYLPLWSAQEDFLLTTAPNQPLEDTEFGTMDLEGHWSVLRSPWTGNRVRCSYKIDLLPHDLMAGYGCGLLVVFRRSGEKLLTVSGNPSEIFASVAGAEHFVAIETDRPTSSLYELGPMQPSQIQVYDLNSGERTLSVKLTKPMLSYALSTEGLLATVEGDVLRMYRPN
jgi:hypothetical protein